MATASSRYFVVRPKSTGLPDGLQAAAAGSTGLFVFRSANAESGPRQQWARLMREYGDQLDFASPVLIDGKGREMLPTGKIVVQFKHPPAGEALQQFAATYGLRYLNTNEFAANQLNFQLAGNEAYLPDLIARLSSDTNVRLADPESMAQYARL